MNDEIREFKKDINRNKEFKCFCNKCNSITNHLIISDIQDFGNDLIDGTNWNDDYQLIQCKSCNDISFRLYGWFSEYQDMCNDGTFEKLFPESEENKRKRKPLSNLPFLLDDIYNEVITSYNNSLLILSAAGIRALLEGICIDKNILSGTIINKQGKEVENRDLYGKIYGLYQNNLISQPQLEALHQLRILGNEAIHQLAKLKKTDITDALDIIEHMIEDIYEIPLKSNNLKKRNATN